MFYLPFLKQQEKYGILIIIISLLTRIFVVSIAWNYGIFLSSIKAKYPQSVYLELGWIAGLAQGIGSVISPLYIWIIKKIGFKLTFFIGMSLCFLSLTTSSFVPNERYLFFTYSFPFGIGSSIIFVLGSILTGLYFPSDHKYHVTATVTVSLGFPAGFLILNPLTETLLLYFENDWQQVQRIYALINFILILVTCPFFTDKHVVNEEHKEILIEQVEFRDEFLNFEPNSLKVMTKVFWLLGLLFNSIANNSILIHLYGYFLSNGLDSTLINTCFLVLGVSDAFFRIMLAIIGQYIKKNLSTMYILSTFIGFFLSNLWSDYTIPAFNTFYCILFGICPAVLMSLMYSVNSEINGTYEMDKFYTINVMTSGIGIILGPIISGFLLDNSKNNYETVFKLALRLYFLSIVFYSLMKFLLIKYSSRHVRNINDITERKIDYIEFDNY